MTQMHTKFHQTTKHVMPKNWFDADVPHTHDPLDDAREQGLMYYRMVRHWQEKSSIQPGYNNV